MALLGHYKLNDNLANTIVTDTSGNNRNGISSVNTANLSILGKINQAFSFTLTDSVDLGALGAWNFGTSDFSIAFWFKTGTILTEKVIIAKRDWVLGVEDGYAIALISGGTTIRVHYNDDFDFIVPTIDDDVWHHVVVNFDYTNAETSLFLDNDFIGVNTHIQATQSNTNNLYVARNTLNNVHFDGELDDLRIYNNKISNTFIFLLYNNVIGTESIINEGQGIDTFTKLMTHMDGLDGSTTFIDSSSSLHTITPQAQAQIDTAQSKFGGASALFDGTSDRLDIQDSENWNFGTSNFTIDFWAKFNVLGFTSHMCSQWEFGNNKSFSIRKINNGTFDMEYRTSGGLNFTSSSTFSLTDLNWHHYAVVRDGNTLRFFVDGIPRGTADWTGVILNNATRVLHVSSLDAGSQAMNGWIDELRISNGIARWSTIFTPRITAYGSNERFINEVITINDINITDSVIRTINENISLNDLNTIQNSTKIINESIIINDLNQAINADTTASFGTKIVSINPLIFVTNTNPVEIVKVDISNPTIPTWVVQDVIGMVNAKDVAYDSLRGLLYVANAIGKVVKIDINDLTSQTTIDLLDTDNLITIDTAETQGLILTGTDSLIGELYLIDERLTQRADARLDVLRRIGVLMETDFKLIETQNLNVRLDVLATQKVSMDSSFVCLTNIIDDIVPLNRNDFTVFLDGIQLNDFDVDLSSINIRHNSEQKSETTFRLNRKHDNFNVDLNNNSKTISNQNGIRIFIKNILEFDGNITKIDCQYNQTEFVIITAHSLINRSHSFASKNLPLPGINQPLGLYDVLIQSPNIFNPVVSAEDLNPLKHKGIFVNLGTKRNQHINRFHFFDGTGSIADSIQDGSFNPKQNSQYFWGSISVNKPEFFGQTNSIFGGSNPFQSPASTKGTGNSVFNAPNITATGKTSAFTFLYIGTSLSPVSEDLWQLQQANYRLQRVFEDIVDRIGVGKLFQVQIQEALPNENFSSIFTSLQGAGYLGGNDLTNKAKVLKSATELQINFSIKIKNIVFSLIDNAFGYYIGIPPFRSISVKSGEFFPDWRWEDKNDGLYSVLDKHFNYTKYAKEVADLELKLLQNINGVILPETSCSMELTIDAYYFYQLQLLNKINIQNTTQSGIFSYANGFPVSIKSISINSNNMKINLQTNNSLSKTEQEQIQGSFPDSNQFITDKVEILISPKIDMRTKLEVK